MTARNPYKLSGGIWLLDNWTRLLKKATHKPRIGVTQGGSSNPNPGCRVAATNGLFKPQEIKRDRRSES